MTHPAPPPDRDALAATPRVAPRPPLTLPNLLAAACLLLSLSLLTLRLAGGWTDRSGHTRALPARWSFTADAAHGRLQLVLFHDARTFTYGPPLPSDPAANRNAWSAWSAAHPPYAYYGRGYGHGFVFSYEPNLAVDAANRPVVAGTRTWLMVPYWSAELTLLLPALLLLARRLLRRRPTPGLCPTCRYDLRATPTRCPECGATFPSIHAGAERSGTPRSAAPDSSFRPFPLILVLLLTSSARAANSVTLYSPDPADPWNRLHATLFLRTAPTGDTFGLDALDPLLWSGTRHHLLEDPSRAAALAAMDAARTAPRDPVKRALLQRDLWSAFDWTADRDRDPDVVRPLQRRLAALLRRVALTADEIRALPDPYAAAVAAHRFPAADDPTHPNTSFLPPDLFDPAGPWIPLRHAADGDDGTVAPIHASDFGDRSVFEAYFRHPAGRQPGLDYLARLAARTRTRTLPGNVPPVGDESLPPLPAGAAFALVRRAVLFDRAGRLYPTRLVESVQFRVYRHGDPWTDARPAQSVHEFVLSRADFLADPARALHAITPGERAVRSPQFRSHGIDPFEFRPSTRPADYTVPALASCRACHAFPGVRSVNSFTRLFGPATPHPALAESPPDLQPSLAIKRKESRPEWRLLRELLTPP